MKNVNQRYFSRRLIRNIRVTTTFGTSTSFAVEKDILLYKMFRFVMYNTLIAYQILIKIESLRIKSIIFEL